MALTGQAVSTQFIAGDTSQVDLLEKYDVAVTEGKGANEHDEPVPGGLADVTATILHLVM